MITSVILVGLGSCIGGIVAIALTAPNEDELNKKIEDAKNEGISITKNELNAIIEQKDMEIKQLKQMKNAIEIEEI